MTSTATPDLQPLAWPAGSAITVRFRMSPAKDITGWSIRCRLFNSEAAIVTKTIGAGIDIVNVLEGVIDVRFVAADTLSLRGEYPLDLWRTDAGAETELARCVVTLD